PDLSDSTIGAQQQHNQQQQQLHSAVLADVSWTYDERSNRVELNVTRIRKRTLATTDFVRGVEKKKKRRSRDFDDEGKENLVREAEKAKLKEKERERKKAEAKTRKRKSAQALRPKSANFTQRSLEDVGFCAVSKSSSSNNKAAKPGKHEK